MQGLLRPISNNRRKVSIEFIAYATANFQQPDARKPVVVGAWACAGKAEAVSDRLAQSRSARQPEERQHPLPDAEPTGRFHGVSEILAREDAYSALMPAVLMIGHHFSISAF